MSRKMWILVGLTLAVGFIAVIVGLCRGIIGCDNTMILKLSEGVKEVRLVDHELIWHKYKGNRLRVWAVVINRAIKARSQSTGGEDDWIKFRVKATSKGLVPKCRTILLYYDSFKDIGLSDMYKSGDEVIFYFTDDGRFITFRSLADSADYENGNEPLMAIDGKQVNKIIITPPPSP